MRISEQDLVHCTAGQGVHPSVNVRTVHANNLVRALGSECDGIDVTCPTVHDPCEWANYPWGSHSRIRFQQTKDDGERIRMIALGGTSEWLVSNKQVMRVGTETQSTEWQTQGYVTW